MIWFTLRRWRISIAIALVLTGVLAFMTLHVGFDYENETATFNRLNCSSVEFLYGTGPSQLPQYGYTGPPLTRKLDNECNKLTSQTTAGPNSADFFEGLLLVVPVLLSIVLAAPLVAEEYRHRTHRVLWTQSVSRARWFAVSFGSILVICLALLIPFFALSGWHERLFSSKFLGSIAPWQFQVSGFVPVAIVIFAAALAVLLGVLIRFSLPAMMGAATLVSFAPWGAEVLRFRVFAPVTTAITSPFLGLTVNENVISDPQLPRALQGAYLLNSGWLPHNLTALSSLSGVPQFPSSCFYDVYSDGVVQQPSHAQTLQCIASGGWHFVLVNEPANRFWTMQIAESALFIALAALCIGLSLWLIKRLSR
jgi:ABC-type transport system involved in multi-copper enzyme maturation permease subunit